MALPLLIDGMAQRHVRDRVDALLDRLEILDRVDRDLSELSGGQVQRVAIARALIAEPELILADEPTGNLDARVGHEVLALMRETCEEQGVTMILVTHDSEASAYADRIVQMNDGRLRESGAGGEPQR